MRFFNNDYNEACHPAILKKFTESLTEQKPGYGTDDCCASAANLIRQ